MSSHLHSARNLDKSVPSPLRSGSVGGKHGAQASQGRSPSTPRASAATSRTPLRLSRPTLGTTATASPGAGQSPSPRRNHTPSPRRHVNNGDGGDDTRERPVTARYITVDMLRKACREPDANLALITSINLTFSPQEHMKIKYIENLEGLRSLRSLNLSGNAIEKLEKLHSLTSLVELRLAGNQISRIEGLDTLANLAMLDVSDNRIARLPSADALRKLVRLRDLRLAGNRLNTLHDISRLKACTTLTNLTLTGNPLTDISHWWLFAVYHLRTLETLDERTVAEEDHKHAKERFSVEEVNYLEEELAKQDEYITLLEGELEATSEQCQERQQQLEAERSQRSVLQRTVTDLEQELSAKGELLSTKSAELARSCRKHYELEQELAFSKLDTKFDPHTWTRRLDGDSDEELESPYLGRARFKPSSYAGEQSLHAPPQVAKLHVVTPHSPVRDTRSATPPTVPASPQRAHISALETNGGGDSAALQAALQQRNAEYQNVVDLAKRLGAELKGTQAELKGTQAELANTKQELVSVHLELNGTRQESLGAQQELAELKQHQNERDDEDQLHARQQLALDDEHRHSLSELHGDNQALRHTLDEAHNQLQQLDALRVQYERQIHELRDELAAKSEQVDGLETSFSSLRQPHTLDGSLLLRLGRLVGSLEQETRHPGPSTDLSHSEESPRARHVSSALAEFMQSNPPRSPHRDVADDLATVTQLTEKPTAELGHRLTKLMESLAEEAELAQRRHAQAANDCERLNQELAAANRQDANHQSAANAELDQVRREVAELQALVTAEQQRSNQQVHVATATAQGLQQTLDQERARAMEQRDSLSDLHGDNQALRHTLDEAHNQLQQLDALRVQYERQIQALQDALAAKSQQADGLEASVSSLRQPHALDGSLLLRLSQLVGSLEQDARPGYQTPTDPVEAEESPRARHVSSALAEFMQSNPPRSPHRDAADDLATVTQLTDKPTAELGHRLTKLMESLAEEAELAHRRHAQAAAECRQLRNEMAAADRKDAMDKAATDAELEQLRNEIAETQALVMSERNDNSQYVNSIKQALSTAKEQLKEQAQTVEDLEAQIDRLSSAKKAAEDRAPKLKAELTQAEAERRRLQEEVKSARARADEAERVLQEELSAQQAYLNQQDQRTREKLRVTEQALSEAKGRLVSQQSSLDELGAQIDRMAAEKDTLEDQLAELQSDLHNATEQLATAQEQLKAQTRTAAEHRAQLERAQAATRSAKEQAADLEAELQNAKQALGAAHHQLKTHQRTADQSLSAAQRKLDVQAQAVDEYRAQIAQLMAAKAAAEDQVARLEAELESTKQAVDAAQQQLTAQSHTADKSLASAQQKLSTQQQAADRQRAQIDRLTAAKRDAETQVARSEAELQHLRAQLAGTEARLKATEAERTATHVPQHDLSALSDAVAEQQRLISRLQQFLPQQAAAADSAAASRSTQTARSGATSTASENGHAPYSAGRLDDILLELSRLRQALQHQHGILQDIQNSDEAPSSSESHIHIHTVSPPVARSRHHHQQHQQQHASVGRDHTTVHGSTPGLSSSMSPSHPHARPVSADIIEDETGHHIYLSPRQQRSSRVHRDAAAAAPLSTSSRPTQTPSASTALTGNEGTTSHTTRSNRAPHAGAHTSDWRGGVPAAQTTQTPGFIPMATSTGYYEYNRATSGAGDFPHSSSRVNTAMSTATTAARPSSSLSQSTVPITSRGSTTPRRQQQHIHHHHASTSPGSDAGGAAPLDGTYSSLAPPLATMSHHYSRSEDFTPLHGDSRSRLFDVSYRLSDGSHVGGPQASSTTRLHFSDVAPAATPTSGRSGGDTHVHVHAPVYGMTAPAPAPGGAATVAGTPSMYSNSGGRTAAAASGAAVPPAEYVHVAGPFCNIAEHQILDEQVSQLRQSLAQSRQTASETRESLAQSRQTARETRELLRSTASASQSLSDSSELLLSRRKELDHVEEQLTQEHAELQQAQQLTNKARTTYKEVTEALNEARSKRLEEEKHLAACRQQVRLVEQESETVRDRIDRMERDNSAAAAESSRHQQSLSSTMAQVRDTEAMLARRRSEEESLERRAAELRKEIQDCEGNLPTALQNHTAVVQRTELAQSTLQSLLERCRVSEEQLSATRQRLAEETERLESLRDEQAATHKVQADLQVQCEKLRNMTEALQGDQARLNFAASSYDSDVIRELKARLSSVTALCEQRESEFATLQQRYASQREEKRRIKDSLRSERAKSRGSETLLSSTQVAQSPLNVDQAKHQRELLQTKLDAQLAHHEDALRNEQMRTEGSIGVLNSQVSSLERSMQHQHSLESALAKETPATLASASVIRNGAAHPPGIKTSSTPAFSANSSMPLLSSVTGTDRTRMSSQVSGRSAATAAAAFQAPLSATHLSSSSRRAASPVNVHRTATDMASPVRFTSRLSRAKGEYENLHGQLKTKSTTPVSAAISTPSRAGGHPPFSATYSGSASASSYRSQSSNRSQAHPTAAVAATASDPISVPSAAAAAGVTTTRSSTAHLPRSISRDLSSPLDYSNLAL